MDTNLQLNDGQRSQLDNIVHQMTLNQEPDSAIQFVVNDFKQKYGNQPTQQPGFFQNLKQGAVNIGKDILGIEQNKSNAFIPSLIRSTIGSQGLAGIAQMPGRVVGSLQSIGDSSQINEQANQAYDQAMELIKKARTETDPQKAELYRKTAQELLNVGVTRQGIANSSAENVMTPGQALGTTVNAELTALTGAKPNLLGELNPKFATLAKGTSFINNAAKATYYGGRIAENAALGVGFQAASNLNDKQSITDNLGVAAAFGGALPIAGAGLSKLKSGILNQAMPEAERVINSLIKPLSKDFAYGKNPARGILNEGIVANTFEDLSHKVTSATENVGSQIGQVGKQIDQAGVTLDLTPALTPIDEAIQKAAKNNNPTLFDSLQNVKVALMHDLNVGVNDAGQPAIVKGDARNLIASGYNEAKQFLTDIAEHTRFTGNPSDDKALNMATKQAYGVARDIMNKGADTVSPEVGATIRNLNERYADLLSAKSAINHRDIVLKRQNFLNLADRFAIPVSVASSLATGLITGDWAKAGTILASEIGTIAVGKGLGSTASKTRIAQFLSKLAPEERQGILNATPVLKNLWERLTGNKVDENAPKTQTLQTIEDYLKNPKLGIDIPQKQ